MELEGN